MLMRRFPPPLARRRTGLPNSSSGGWRRPIQIANAYWKSTQRWSWAHDSTTLSTIDALGCRLALPQGSHAIRRGRRPYARRRPAVRHPAARHRLLSQHSSWDTTRCFRLPISKSTMGSCRKVGLMQRNIHFGVFSGGAISARNFRRIGLACRYPRRSTFVKRRICSISDKPSAACSPTRE